MEQCHLMEKLAVVHITKTSTRKTSFIEFSNVRWAPLLFGILMCFAIFTPYIIAVIRGTVNPLLPFISQAAGSPPQSGIFSILLGLSSTVGFIGLHMLHLGICIYEERVPKEKQHVLVFLNKVSLVPGHLALLGMIIVGGYPIDFHRNNEDWVLVSVAPHLTGAILLFGGGVAYSGILTIIMAITFPQRKKLLGFRIVMLLTTILSAFIHAITIRKAFALEYYDQDRLSSCSLKIFEYDNNYLLCSVCEWVMAIAFISTFLTLESEGKIFSFTMSVNLLESSTDSPAATGFSNPLPMSDSLFESKENILGKLDEVPASDQSDSTKVMS